MSSFDYKLHVFRSPQFKGIVNNAIKFFAQTPVHELPPPHRFVGTGVYVLYYTGNFKPYAQIAALNKPNCTQPIYVGNGFGTLNRTLRQSGRTASKWLLLMIYGHWVSVGNNKVRNRHHPQLQPFSLSRL